ncbi:MAG: hypothetical protein QNK11_04505 [Legionella sp.]|nr:hypothetical protein [Legionella sp.]
MNAKQYSKAREKFAQALKNDPRECHLHFLNGLSYQLEGKASNYRLLDIASVGYDSAIKFCPNEPWAYYYLGLIHYQKKDYPLAEVNFAKAMRLGTGKSRLPFFEAFIRSAEKTHDQQSIQNMIAQLEKIDPRSPLIKKLKAMRNKIAASTPSRNKNKAPEKDASLVLIRDKAKKQVLIDAVFIISREVDEELRGVNLLSGLQMQYGVDTATTRFGTSNWKHYADALNTFPVLGSTGGNPALSYSSLVTHALSLPTINYNLNIFNNLSEHDQIISRPTLLARDGMPAHYFSGKEALLGVAGLNSGQVQIIPLGLSLHVTPKFQEDGSLDLDVELGREFLNENVTSVGGFGDAASALKEHTHTHVNVHFGESIILSSLSETLNAYSVDKTPGIGDLPLLRLAFGRKELFRQNVSLLILITPREPVAFESNKRVPDEQIAELYNYITKLIEPSTNFKVISKALSKLPLYTQDKLLGNPFYSDENTNLAMNTSLNQMDVY